MNLKKYEGYFHDGGINIISQQGDKIEIWMESCEILPEWIEVDLPLSKSNAIAGKLILSGVKKIIVDTSSVSEFKQVYDSAIILQLNIFDDNVDLLIEWCNYPPKERSFKFEHIIIFASTIEWENIPDLLDSF